jgi:hypothetical protein
MLLCESITFYLILFLVVLFFTNIFKILFIFSIGLPLTVGIVTGDSNNAGPVASSAASGITARGEVILFPPEASIVHLKNENHPLLKKRVVNKINFYYISIRIRKSFSISKIRSLPSSGKLFNKLLLHEY